MLLFQLLHIAQNVFVLCCLLPLTAASRNSFTILPKQIEERARPYQVVYNRPLGQPQSAPVCVPEFGKPSQHDCERAAGGSQSSPPRGGLEWEFDGHLLSHYFRDHRAAQFASVDLGHTFILPRTYAYGNCIIVLLMNSSVETGYFDLAAMNTIRWATVRMTRDCGGLHSRQNPSTGMGGWQIGGQAQKIWMLSLELPADKRGDRISGVSVNSGIHLDMFLGCDFGSPQSPRAPEMACPNWDQGSGGSSGESDGTDSSTDVADSGVSVDTANIGVQYSIDESGDSGCGWGEEWKEAVPRIPSESDLMWGIDFRKFGLSVGTCVLSSLSIDLPTKS